MSYAAKVGITVLAAAALLAYATFSLRATLKGPTNPVLVSFQNALGVQPGAPVRVQGVEMGAVDRVTLGRDGRALLRLLVRKEYTVGPRDAIAVVGGLLSLNPPYVEITPNGREVPVVRSESEPFRGDDSSSSTEIMTESEKLLRNLNRLTARMTDLADNLAKVAGNDRLRANLTRMTGNFARISESGVAIARNMEGATSRSERLVASFQNTAGELNRTLRETRTLLGRFQRTADATRGVMEDTRGLLADTRAVVRDSSELVRGTGETVKNAGGLVTDTRAVLGENRERLQAVFDSLNGALKQLDGTLADTRQLLGDAELRDNFRQTSRNLRDATENLKKISADVQGITGDPNVQQDLRTTLGGVKDVTQQAGDVLRRAQSVLGSGGKTAKGIGQKLSDAKFRLDLLRMTRSEQTRLDLDAYIPWSRDTFYRVGFYDFGESNRFNVQAGQQLRPGVAARMGFRASKLGLGLDFGKPLQPVAFLDVYGIDRPRVDARANFPLTSFLDLTLGFDDVTGSVDPVVGLRYRK